MIGHVTGDSGEPAQAGGIASLDCPLGHESLEQPARRRQVTAEIVGDGETETVGYRPPLRSRPALQPAYGPQTRRGRLRPVIVCRQLERGKQRDVGRRPPRLWRETWRLGQPLSDIGGATQGGERPYFRREHGELVRVAAPAFEGVLQLAAVIAHQVVSERQVEPVN